MTALIVAAGYSSRANAFKPLLKLGSRTVIEMTIASFVTTCKRVVIVGGHNFSELEQFIKESEYLNKLDVEIIIIYNRDFDRGMFTSIKAGCSYLQSGDFFFTPGDIPGVKIETVEAISKVEGEVVLPSFNYKSGHPVKLSNNIRKAILEYPDNGTLRDVLNVYKKKYVSLNDEAILMDLDTPEDYQRVVSYFDKIIKE